MTIPPDSPEDQSPPIDTREPEKRAMRSHLLWGYHGILRRQRLAPWAEDLFFQTAPKADACQHDFKGWREFEDGNGGTTVCTKCGMTAFEHSLRYGP